MHSPLLNLRSLFRIWHVFRRSSGLTQEYIWTKQWQEEKKLLLEIKKKLNLDQTHGKSGFCPRRLITVWNFLLWEIPCVIVERWDQNPTSSFECQCHAWIKTSWISPNDICPQTCCWSSDYIWDRKEFPHVVTWQNFGVCLVLVHCSRTIFWSLVSHSLTFCSLVIRAQYSAFPTTGPCFVSKGFCCFTKQVWMDLIFLHYKDDPSNGKNNLHYCLPGNKIQGKVKGQREY